MVSGKKTIAIVTSGYFPVPAVLGGAVETLDENLIRQNEVYNCMNLVIFSCYNKNALKEAEKYKNSCFKFIYIPAYIKMMDKIIYFAAKHILRLKKNMSYRYIIQRLYYIKRVAQFLRDNDFDKVVLENHASLFLTLKKYGNRNKYAGKYYYHLHNVVTNCYGCENIIANCRKVIGVSNYINKTMQRFLGQNDHNEYCVLRNRIDREKFFIHMSIAEKKAIRNKYRIADNDIVILFSGRFNPEKGIKELLLAFKQIDMEEVKLLIVGGYYFDSGMVSEFEKEMYKLANNMKEKVRFTGFISYSQMPQIYAIADIVVIPSVWEDPAPLTVIEALTSGKALITTNSGGIPEYADTESCIILQKKGELITDLAVTIKELIVNADIRNLMESKAKEKTYKWTAKAFYDDFTEIMRDC